MDNEEFKHVPDSTEVIESSEKGSDNSDPVNDEEFNTQTNQFSERVISALEELGDNLQVLDKKIEKNNFDPKIIEFARTIIDPEVIGTRTFNYLETENLTTHGILSLLSPQKLKRTPGIGKDSINKIKSYLDSFNINQTDLKNIPLIHLFPKFSDDKDQEISCLTNNAEEIKNLQSKGIMTLKDFLLICNFNDLQKLLPPQQDFQDRDSFYILCNAISA